MALSREEIAARYGAALFAYAQDKNALDSIYDELAVLKKAVQSNQTILNILSDPVLSEDEKDKTLKAIEAPFSPEVQNLLNLLLEYDRCAYLIDIINRFDHLYDNFKAIASGTATTAVKLDEDQLKRLGESYAKKYNLKAVRLENQVDPKILGGVILQINDRVIDGSVKTKLKMIRAQLEEN